MIMQYVLDTPCKYDAKALKPVKALISTVQPQLKWATDFQHSRGRFYHWMEIVFSQPSDIDVQFYPTLFSEWQVHQEQASREMYNSSWRRCL